MHHTRPLFVCALLLSTLAAQAPPVSPNDRAGLEGSTFTHLPLGRASARIQTLHLDLPGGTVISGHAYRREAAGVYGSVDGFSSDLEITVSMSPNTPAQASPAFGSNHGPNPVTVLPRTLLPFPGTSRPTLDPAPAFELVIPYQVPFTVPPQGGTVCVDVTVYGNVTTTGNDRNFSAYLDGHTLYSNGDAEQPGFRYGTGCAAPGNTSPTYGSFSLWHLGTELAIDLSLRRGIAADGSGLTRVWVALGLQPTAMPWPSLGQCTIFGSNEVWFIMPGTPTTNGSYDGTLSQLPVLPAGIRLWCQTGSAHLGNGALSFGDGVAIVTPPAGPQPIPTRRIANSTNGSAASGSLSWSVPVMLFF